MANKLVKYDKIYDYKDYKRTETTEGRRYLTPDGHAVPSVTTILDKTKPEEKRQALQEWRNRVGHAKAQEITTEAAGRGTSMHSHLENWLLHGEFKSGSNMVHQQGRKMAEKIVNETIKGHLEVFYGNEAKLYYPQLYAGTTDLVGVYDGKPSIIDFKQTNKPKRTEWIDDYFLQGAAYSQAHNHLYNTDIAQIVILMCSKDLEIQRWIVNKQEYQDWCDKWWDRVSLYYLAN